jgi:hypothetical protein
MGYLNGSAAWLIWFRYPIGCSIAFLQIGTKLDGELVYSPKGSVSNREKPVSKD